MQLSCPDCGSRFRVDPRARGRTFRVACRRCGAWIVHQGSAPPPDAAVWHVHVAGTPVGPLRTALVIDLLERGSLGDDPIAWREGSDGWLRLADLEPFMEASIRWRQRREATAVLHLDPNGTAPRIDDPSPTATRPIGPVEFVVELDAELLEEPRERVSRLAIPREDATGVFSLDALRQQAQSTGPVPVELPAFPPAALAAVAVPPTAPPVETAPIVVTPPPKVSSHVGLYVMLFLLMASVGGLGALVFLRDREPVVVTGTPDRADLNIASMSRREPIEVQAATHSTPAPVERAPRQPEADDDKPSPEVLKAALSKVRADAKRCGPEHGAAPGTKVEVKISIAGERGRVISAIAKPPYADPLGRCVADALRTAAFPTFRKPTLTLLYTVTM